MLGKDEVWERIAVKSAECDEIDALLNGREQLEQFIVAEQGEERREEQAIRDYIERGRDQMDSLVGRSHTIGPHFPSLALLNQQSGLMRRICLDQELVVYGNEAKNKTTDKSLFQLFCLVNNEQAKKWKLIRKLSTRQLVLRIGEIIGSLSYLSHTAIIQLLPGGELVQEAYDFIHNLSLYHSTVVEQDLREKECIEGINRLLNAFLYVRLDLNVEEQAILIFALLRLSLDERLTSECIVRVLQRVFEMAVTENVLDQLTTLLKSLLPSLTVSVLHQVLALHQLALVDNPSMDELLTELVVEILIGWSERAELIECHWLETLSQTFSSIERRVNAEPAAIWALVLLLDVAIRPKMLQSVDQTRFDSFIHSIRKYRPSIRRSQNDDDKIIDIFISTLLQRCHFIRIGAHPAVEDSTFANVRSKE